MHYKKWKGNAVYCLLGKALRTPQRRPPPVLVEYSKIENRWNAKPLFTQLLVCLNCGLTEFVFPEEELQVISADLPEK
jgi:hypothetical protein